MGVYDPRKVLGVTTLDVVRAKTFFADKAGLDVAQVDVPVVGGHAGITILPLFSQATPATPNKLGKDELDALTKRTQDGGTEVVTAKAGKGSATLSMAYAAALFADACLRGLAGHVATECAFVESTVTDVPFFASKVKLGPDGVETVHGLGPMTDYEREALAAMKPELLASIDKGIKFVQENSK
jgi:malate dehydrogenase